MRLLGVSRLPPRDPGSTERRGEPMMKRRLICGPRRLTGLTVAAMLVLGACQPAGAPPATVPPAAATARPAEATQAAAPAAAPATTAQPAETTKPAEAARPAASGEPIRVGFSAAMSGGLGG